MDRILRTGAQDPYAAPDERPLVVVGRHAGALRIDALDGRAEAAGCRLAMPLAEARAVCPELRAVPADPEADGLLLEAIADWCDRYTPLVALDGPHGLLLDVSGCAHAFGGEAALLENVVAALSARGFEPRAAIAGVPGAARALARFTSGGVAAPGHEAAQVAALPIDALDPDDQARLGLQRAGLKTVGAVASRGRGEIAARFGAGLGLALERALGQADQPISPRRPAPVRVVERRFAEPVLALDAALAALRALADALGRRLEAAGEGVRAVEAAFFRSDGKVVRAGVGTGAPTRDPEMLLRLLREKLDALADPLDPGFGFDLIRLSALAVEPLTPQPRSLDAAHDDAAHGGDAVAAVVDRLAARHGRHRVLRFVARDAHRPEAEARARPAQDSGTGGGGWPAPAGAPPRRPLRMFEIPEPVDVLAEVPDGPPVRFVWRRVTHAVARAEGPERIALEWWRRGGAGLTRDYFRVEDVDGARFWLYRDGLYLREAEHPRWFLHGLFA